MYPISGEGRTPQVPPGCATDTKLSALVTMVFISEADL